MTSGVQRDQQLPCRAPLRRPPLETRPACCETGVRLAQPLCEIQTQAGRSASHHRLLLRRSDMGSRHSLFQEGISGPHSLGRRLDRVGSGEMMTSRFGGTSYRCLLGQSSTASTGTARGISRHLGKWVSSSFIRRRLIRLDVVTHTRKT